MYCIVNFNPLLDLEGCTAPSFNTHRTLYNHTYTSLVEAFEGEKFVCIYRILVPTQGHTPLKFSINNISKRFS